MWKLNKCEQAFLSPTWSVILRAFLLVESVPSIQEICRVAASNAVEAARERVESR